MGQHGFKEIRKCPSEKPSRGRRTVWGMTIEVMQDRPDLVSLRWQPPLIVMEWCQRTVTAFHGRGGPLQGEDLLRGPRTPRLQGLRRQLLGEGMLVQRALPRLPGLLQRGFPLRATRVSPLVFPREPWQ